MRAQTDSLMVGNPFDHVPQVEHGKDVAVEVHIAGHVRSDQSELVGCPQNPPEGPLSAEQDAGRSLRVTGCDPSQQMSRTFTSRNS